MVFLTLNPSDLSGQAFTAGVLCAAVKLAALITVRRNHNRRFEKVGTVAELYIYPVKSCGAMVESKAAVTSVGLQAYGLSDRHWMILSKTTNEIISMKEAPKLTCVKSESVGDDLRLTAPGMPPLYLPKQPDLKKAKVVNTKFDNQQIPVIECGAEADQWISDYLKKPMYIVFSCADLGTRDTYDRVRDWSNTARPGDVSIFAYLTSYMITSTASLKEVNSNIESPVATVNFRPNILVDNDIPFDEDNWTDIRIGDQTLFHAVEPCIRCIITTIDPNTGEWSKSRQPLAHLKKTRCREPYGRSPVFGLYVSNDVPGIIKTGDPVYAIRSAPRQ